jgi:hypothetical protein
VSTYNPTLGALERRRRRDLEGRRADTRFSEHTELAPAMEVRFALFDHLNQACALLRDVSEPDLDSSLRFLRLAERCVMDMNEAARLSGSSALVTRLGVLQSALPAFAACAAGNVRAAVDWISTEWHRYAELAGAMPEAFTTESPAIDGLDDDKWMSAEAFAMFNLAVSEHIAQVNPRSAARQAIDHLRVYLDLDFDALGTICGVSGEVIRQYAEGAGPLPPSARTVIVKADSQASRLIKMFRPERLADVIRRPARSFGNRRALDWILEGRIEEVADEYDRRFRYQE